MKVSVIVLALLIALFGQSHAAPNAEENTLQEICGKKAGAFYKNKFENSFEKGTTAYRPHYNKNSNKCFVSISIHGYRKNGVKVDSIYTALYDLNTNKELGSLFQIYGDRNEPMPHCITPDKPVAKCTPADWDEFIQRYLVE